MEPKYQQISNVATPTIVTYPILGDYNRPRLRYRKSHNGQKSWARSLHQPSGSPAGDPSAIIAVTPTAPVPVAEATTDAGVESAAKLFTPQNKPSDYAIHLAKCQSRQLENCKPCC